MDNSVSVVAVEAEMVQLFTEEVSEVSVVEVDFHSDYSYELVTTVAEATSDLEDQDLFNCLLDVGWYNSQNNIITYHKQRDPGGVLSIFYI